MSARPATLPISEQLARFVASFEHDSIPAAARERAKYLLLDAVGIALASTQQRFAQVTLAGLRLLGAGGEHCVIGLMDRLSLRDAVLMNGLLVRGLDFDDFHPMGAIHPTASLFPCALGIAEKAGADGKALLAAYVLGVEAVARLASVAKGGLYQAGFDPTGLIGAFGCALVAGRLLGGSVEQLVMAQGLALSTASGSLEFLEDGAWSDRVHAGWAGVAGITAAAMARAGFVAPRGAYEGRLGLFPSHLGPLETQCDYRLATAGLGEEWEIERVAVKPIPACHLAHGCAEAALALAREENLKAREVASVRVIVPPEVVQTICEPEAARKRPRSAREAQLSVQYVTAAALARRRFGLEELTPGAWSDPVLLALADKVEYGTDGRFPFPRYWPGEVIVTTTDGRRLARRVEKNRGAGERPLSGAEIEAKYLGNAQTAISGHRAQAIRDVILALEDCPDAREVANGMAGERNPWGSDSEPVDPGSLPRA